MSSHIVGYPRIGPKRELKFALESFWEGKTGVGDLQTVAANLRNSIWKHMADAGIKYIPSNTFSYYDQMLDTTAMLGAVPSRYGWKNGEIGFDVYFSMARGNDSVPAMEMTKWFDTNYHYIVPELGPDVELSYASHKAVDEFKEAKALGIDTVPVLIGPLTYLLLSKPAKGVDKSFCMLSLIDKILPIYKEVFDDLKSAGARWIQFDEPILVMDLDTNQLQAFSDAYSHMESSLAGLNVLIATYFADVPAEAYKTLTSLKCVTGFGFDFVRGLETLDLIKGGFPRGKLLFAGVVDGRNIWANDLSASLKTLQSLEEIVGKDKVVVSTSCSLLHTAVDLVNEVKLDKELKSWLAFAAQKVVEVNALAKSLSGVKDEALFSANSMGQASRRSSPRVTNAAVQQDVAAVKKSDHRRSTEVSARLQAQQKKLNLPALPTTTIGSFPQTADLRRIRREFKAKKISDIDYVQAIKVEFEKVVKLQEELGIDVLVHGEAERNDMVEYFGEQLSGFAFTSNGWVQSYGSRCVKPPIIYGDVTRPKAMTVFWSSMAQKMTQHPMKGMLTGPVTILNWSFVRNDQPRHETCFQIALAIKDEVEAILTPSVISGENGFSDLQIHKHLKRLNKPPLKSIKSPDGDVIDCVPITDQPALAHPLLINHTVQMRPSFNPESVFSESKVSSESNDITQLWHVNGKCPEDTVPIRRTRKQDLYRASSVEKFGMKSQKSIPKPKSYEPASVLTQNGHQHAIMYVEDGVFYGAKAKINVWNPDVEMPNEFSLAQIWVLGGNFNSDLNSIEAGWQVSPQLYGDTRTRLFTYWTSDAYQGTGCYNLLCSGFVQINREIAMGGSISPLSGYGNSQYDITILIWKDPKEGHWWLQFGEKYIIGYWPASLFSYLSESASMIEWGGEVVNSQSEEGKHTTTQMGSGRFAEEGWGKASYFKNVQVVDGSNELRNPENLQVFTDQENCYNVKSGDGGSWGSHFYYGGPGRNSNCP